MKSFRKVLIALIVSMICLFCLNGEIFAKTKKRTVAVSHNIYGTPALRDEINRIISSVNPSLNVGVQVKSMRGGEVLYTRSAQQFFTPASILKVLTAEAALLYLGPGYKYSTVFTTDAKTQSNGVLQGNLYLVHSGDPSLTYASLTDLMASLRARQIQQVNGNIYIDTSAYDEALFGPGWVSNDTRFCYGAPISASIINHNCMVLRPVPKNNYSQGVNAVMTNIVHYNRSLMQSLFARYGIQVNGNILPGTSPHDLPIVAAHNSKELRDLISQMLKKSDNVIAGSLFKKMGELYSRQPGSWQNGSAAVTQILKEKTGLSFNNMTILDGSGLSRDNQITPAQMMQVLDYAFHNTATNYDFISALPIAGIDGTLKHRMKNIAWKVRAKTGSMSGVVALAGYAITKDKEPLAFVIIINARVGMGWRYKEMENKIMTALTNYSRE